MINISIESFKLLLNEINQIENKNSFIIIREDALLSKGASNEEMASQDHHLHLCDTKGHCTLSPKFSHSFFRFFVFPILSYQNACNGYENAENLFFFFDGRKFRRQCANVIDNVRSYLFFNVRKFWTKISDSSVCNGLNTENTSLLVNNSNISLQFPPRHIHGNYFCWGFAASFSL